MATYGVTSAGFVAKSLSTINAEVDNDLRKILGDTSGVESDGTLPAASYAGQLKALIVDLVAAQWDLMEAVHASFDPNQATGESQDALAALVGAKRVAAQYSRNLCIASGTSGTDLPKGRAIKNANTGTRWLTAGVTVTDPITFASAWIGTHAYSYLAIVSNNGNVYVCITAGTSAGAGGPTTTSTDITDGTVHWRYLSAGNGYAFLTVQAQDVGPVEGLASTLTVIDTPVSGWNAVWNPIDAVTGNLEETDSDFRSRRDEELAAAGNATPDAIRANILLLNSGSTDPAHLPVSACTVYNNFTDFTDANGLPPHSVEVLVKDGTDADIALAVWQSVGAGTVTFGNQTSTIFDSQGNSQTVKWSRPVAVNIYVTATAKFDQSLWPIGSETIVAQAALSALLTYCDGFVIGLDVRTSPLVAAMLRSPSQTDSNGIAVVPADPASPPVVGLFEIETIYIGTAPSPVSGTQITITPRQIAVFDSTRCVITAAAESP